MATDEMFLHIHEFSLGLEAWHGFGKLGEHLNIVQMDEVQLPGEKPQPFVAGFEAKNYPIYGYIYHPEYMFTDWVGPGRFPKYDKHRTAAEEMVFRYSLQLNRDGRKNNHRLNKDNSHLVEEINPNKNELKPFPLAGPLINYAYGF